MKQIKKTKNPSFKDIIKAINKGGREEQFERNGGGQWVAVNRIHKNKKKYDRKQKRKEMRDLDASLFFFSDYVIFGPNVLNLQHE